MMPANEPADWLSGTPSQTTFTFQAVVGTPTAGQTFIFNGLMF